MRATADRLGPLQLRSPQSYQTPTVAVKPRPTARPTPGSVTKLAQDPFEETQLLRKRCHLWEQDLSQAMQLTQHVSALRDRAESDSYRATAQLQGARQQFAATLSQLQKHPNQAPQASQVPKPAGSRGPDEVAQETSVLRKSLHILCKQLREQAQKGDQTTDSQETALLQGVADIGGQVLLAMASLGDVNRKLQLAEMQTYHPSRAFESGNNSTHAGDVSSTVLDAAKALHEQAVQAADMLRLREAASEQALLQEEAVSLRSELHLMEGYDVARAKARMEYAEQIGRDANHCLEEIDEATGSGVHFQQTEVSAQVAAPLLVLGLQNLARAQRWARTSELTAMTWKALMENLTNHATHATHLEELVASDALQPLASAFSSPFIGELSPEGIADKCISSLEAHLSNISSQWHHAVSVCCKMEMDLRSLEAQMRTKPEVAAKEAAAEMLQQVSAWNQDLLQRCISWLTHATEVADWHAMAAVRELGLEHAVRDLVSMNQALREHIWSLEAEHENLSSAASCQSHSADSIPRGMRDGSGLQQHIDSLKSDLGSARGELCAVKEQFDVIKHKLHHALHDAESVSRNHESPRSSGGNQSIALAQICPVLASIARQMQHMCQETDIRKRSDACHMVLEELERTRSWCRQVQQELKQQGAMAAKLLAAAPGDISVDRSHKYAFVSAEPEPSHIEASISSRMLEPRLCHSRPRHLSPFCHTQDFKNSSGRGRFFIGLKPS